VTFDDLVETKSAVTDKPKIVAAQIEEIDNYEPN